MLPPGVGFLIRVAGSRRFNGEEIQVHDLVVFISNYR